MKVESNTKIELNEECKNISLILSELNNKFIIFTQKLIEYNPNTQNTKEFSDYNQTSNLNGNLSDKKSNNINLSLQHESQRESQHGSQRESHCDSVKSVNSSLDKDIMKLFDYYDVITNNSDFYKTSSIKNRKISQFNPDNDLINLKLNSNKNGKLSNIKTYEQINLKNTKIKQITKMNYQYLHLKQFRCIIKNESLNQQKKYSSVLKQNSRYSDIDEPKVNIIPYQDQISQNVKTDKSKLNPIHDQTVNRDSIISNDITNGKVTVINNDDSITYFNQNEKETKEKSLLQSKSLIDAIKNSDIKNIEIKGVRVVRGPKVQLILDEGDEIKVIDNKKQSTNVPQLNNKLNLEEEMKTLINPKSSLTMFINMFSCSSNTSVQDKELNNQTYLQNREIVKIKEESKRYLRDQISQKLDMSFVKLNVSQNKHNNSQQSDVDNVNESNETNPIKTHPVKDLKQNDNAIKQLIFELNKFPQCILIVDELLDILYYNQKVCNMLLQDKNELMNKNLTSIIASENPQQLYDQTQGIIQRMMLDSLTSEEVGDFEWPIQDQTFNTLMFNIRLKLHSINDANGEKSNYLILFMKECSTFTETTCSFDPSTNKLYLLWSMLIALTLVQLFVQMPQDIAFGEEEMIFWNFVTDMVITGIQTVDIGLNFFAAFEDANGKIIYNNIEIAKQQMKTQLMLDIVSTVPLDQIFTFIAFNTSVIKSIRIIKIFKFIKLFRVLKQVSQSYTKNNFIENIQKEQGKDIYISLKRTSGLSELIYVNFYILIAAHYQTIIQYWVKMDIENGDKGWIFLQQGITEEMSNFGMYMYLVSQSVKTALGLAVISPVNQTEIILTTIWMFLGLSMFGQGIGNISSQLSNAIQDEMEQINSVNQFEKLCQSNGVDQKVYKEILAEVEDHFDHDDEVNFLKQASLLSHKSLTNLEIELYSQFVSRFKMLSYLKIPIVRQLKSSLKGTISKKIVFGSEINEVIFITKGFLIIQDDQMKLVQDQGVNEMFGLGYFCTQCKQKFNVDIDQMQIKYLDESYKQKEHQDLEEQEKAVKQMISNLKKERYGIDEDEMNIEVDNELEELNKLGAEDDDVKLQLNLTPVFSDDVEMIKIPFNKLEDILFSDLESFFIIYKQNLKQFEPIDPEQRIVSRDSMNNFKNSPQIAFLLLENGEIQDANDMIFKSEYDNLVSIIGMNIIELNTNKDVEKLSDIKENTVLKFKVKKSKYQVKVIEVDQFKLCKTIQEADDSQYQSLKKSLMQVKAVFIEVSRIK